MKYKVLKDIPGYKAGDIITQTPDYEYYNNIYFKHLPDFFQPIPETPKSIYDLKNGDLRFYIEYFKEDGVYDYIEKNKEDLLSYFALCKELN